MIKTTVRAPDELMERLRRLAERNRRSVHAELLTRLEAGIKAAEAAERRKEAADAKAAH